MKKLVDYKIDFPDGNALFGDIDFNSNGWILLERACEFAQIQEKELFGLTYQMDVIKLWLRNDKPISKQLKGHRIQFTFAVKYYVPHPLVIKDEVARHYFFLQIRSDILKKRFPCSFVSLALLSSYVVQSEMGDHKVEMNGPVGFGYIQSLKLCSNPSVELLEKIVELHKTHYGLPPVEAEMNFLENAKHLSLYGVHMYPVKDEQGFDMSVGIYHSGILVYLDKLRVNRFVWMRILTMSRDANQFVIHLRPSQGESKDYKVVYKLANPKEAKHLWRLAVDHHLFFRMKENYHTKESPFRPFGTSMRPFDEEEPVVGSTLPRVRGQTLERQSMPTRQTVIDPPLINPLKSIERAEAHLEESVMNNTVAVLRSPGKSYSTGAERDEIDDVIYRQQPHHTLSQEQQIYLDHAYEPRPHLSGYDPPGHLGGAYELSGHLGGAYELPGHGGGAYEPPGYGGGAYEPCGRYLDRSKHSPTVGDSGHRAYKDYGEPVQYRYDVDRESHSDHNLLRGGFSYCQHRDVALHESPKMIFQDQCHYTCSCDKIWQDRKNNSGRNDGSFQKEQRKTYMTSTGDQVTEYQISKENVTETYIERRSSDYDDMLLSEAIQETTGMDNNLRVEKIEVTADVVQY